MLELSPYLIDENTYFHVLIGYNKVQNSSLSEYYVASVISIATILLWIIAVLSIQKLKVEKVKTRKPD